jgi:aerobic-type carbon monoxide dehydrogenase small subunit (CoxS/CutS family)
LLFFVFPRFIYVLFNRRGNIISSIFVNSLTLLKIEAMVLSVNGKKHEVNVPPDAELLFVLRNDLDLTGSKYGCGEGECGACTVLIDGKAKRSCITQVKDVAGKEITTIEGLEKNGNLHAVQEAFLKTDPFQCSYCASGMIMSTVSLLKNNPSPTDEDILTAMNGNICRCGTYLNIVKAIKLASTTK